MIFVFVWNMNIGPSLLRHKDFFFLEHAGELRIFVLRHKDFVHLTKILGMVSSRAWVDP